VAVVDDRDERKVRLLSKADDFEAGRPMEFTILSRLEKGLAFVTVEGEKVEQVVTATLDKGKKAITLGPPPALTRDFTVSVLMMQGNAFHADVRDFRVKAPEVQIEAEKEYRPGEVASIKVKTGPGREIVVIAATARRGRTGLGLLLGLFGHERLGGQHQADRRGARGRVPAAAT
jgi:uncharacterized protein YfaS (alpha-2-macroglobulin family)